MPTQWIDQVRQLLARASDQRREAFANLDALKSSIDAALDAAKHARRQDARPCRTRCAASTCSRRSA